MQPLKWELRACAFVPHIFLVQQVLHTIRGVQTRLTLRDTQEEDSKPGVGFFILRSSSREAIQRTTPFVVVVNPGPDDPENPRLIPYDSPREHEAVPTPGPVTAKTAWQSEPR
ncbi:hypothetical protein MTO96_020484 [Rhipicephalus appendiculatus]